MGCGASSNKGGVSAEPAPKDLREKSGGPAPPPLKEPGTTETPTPASRATSATRPSQPSASVAAAPAAAAAAPAESAAAAAPAAAADAGPAPSPVVPAEKQSAAQRPPSSRSSAGRRPPSAPPAPSASAPSGERLTPPATPAVAPPPAAAVAAPPARTPAISESGAAAAAAAGALADMTTRPAMQFPRLSAAPLSCLAPPRPDEGASTSELPAGARELIEQLAAGGGDSAVASAAASIRQLLCGRGAPIGKLLEAGAAAALVRCLREGPAAAKVDAAWALTNIAASPTYQHAEALCNAGAAGALAAALEAAASASGPGRPSSSGSARGSRSGGRPGLAEQLLWALGNIAGAVHPEFRVQALAAQVLDAGALKVVLAVIEAEANAAVSGTAAAAPAAARGDSGDGAPSPSAPPLPQPVPGPASPLLRCASWCLHNLSKHKREKDMVDAIPLATRLVLEASDPEVLVCACWLLAFLGSNEDNKSHLRQALPALPRLVEWVSDASSPLATPSLLCLGTMCTGYMRSLDYSGQVVEAGGVPAMLCYLTKAAAAGHRGGVKEALFALSNVAGGSNATVKAMLDAGAFAEVLSLLRSAGSDEEVRTECLYVLTNPWDPLVGAEVATVQQLLSARILHEFHELLVPDAPPRRLGLLLRGLADGLKRGQQLMTAAATAALLEHGREGAAALPPPSNPVVQLYLQLGTVGRIEALNSHPAEEVATRANGILTVLKFFV